VTASDQRQDFFFIAEDDPPKIQDLIVDLPGDASRASTGWILSQTSRCSRPCIVGHRGRTVERRPAGGAESPRNGAPELLRGGRIFRVGDRVLQLRNNYDKGIYNGDLGRIAAIDPSEQSVVVQIDGRDVSYDFSDLDELALAYAVTVHKSQGSEYPAVIVPVHTTHYLMLQRNLLYTAITRARRLLVLVGTRKALAIATKNDVTRRRYSRLRERLTASGAEAQDAQAVLDSARASG